MIFIWRNNICKFDYRKLELCKFIKHKQELSINEPRLKAGPLIIFCL
jgi:hypothetical protein